VAVLPKPKQNPGTARERAKRAKAHAQHRAHKQGRQTKPPRTTAQRSAQTWGLFTTAPTVGQAVAAYAQRMPMEETFRDWQSGWGVRAAVGKLSTEAMVERLSSVVCLTYTLQMSLGQRVSMAPQGQQRRVQWTVTDRVRGFWCGHRLFDAPGSEWSGWLAQQWESLGQPGAAVQATPRLEPVLEEAA